MRAHVLARLPQQRQRAGKRHPGSLGDDPQRGRLGEPAIERFAGPAKGDHGLGLPGLENGRRVCIPGRALPARRCAQCRFRGGDGNDVHGRLFCRRADEPAEIIAAALGRVEQECALQVGPHRPHFEGEARHEGGAQTGKRWFRAVEARAVFLERRLRNALVLVAPEAAAHAAVNGAPVVEEIVGVGRAMGGLPAIRHQLFEIALEQRPQAADPLGRVAILMFGEDAAVVGNDSGEMHEMEVVFAGHPVFATLRGDRAVQQIPVGEVVAGMAQDEAAAHECRRQIHPALVGEFVIGNVHDGVAVAAPRPPADELDTFGNGGGAEEAQIVDARFHDAEVAGLAPVVERPQHVRRQHHGVAVVEGAADMHERAQQQDVGIDVEKGRRPEALEQPQEHGWLDGGREFHHVVDERHPVEIGDAEVAGAHDLRRQRGVVDLRREFVAEHDEAAGLGVRRAHRFHQCRRVGQVIVGDDREDDEVARGSDWKACAFGRRHRDCGLDGVVNSSVLARR